MRLIAIALVVLASVVTVANIGGGIEAYRRGRRGEEGGYSSLFLLSLAFCVLAWLVSRDQAALWVFLPAILDPANWLLLALPVFLLVRARDQGKPRERRVRRTARTVGASGYEAPGFSSDVLGGATVERLEGMTFDEALAADTLGLLLPECLPEVATQALCAGLDSPNLAALAGESPRAASAPELHLLFERALEELGVDRPASMHAAETLRDYYARRVVAGEVSARRGAEAIVRGVLARVRDDLPPGGVLGDSLGISRLVGLFYDYDLVPQGYGSREELDTAVVAECRRILGHDSFPDDPE